MCIRDSYGAEAQFLLDKMQAAGVNTSLLRLGEGANGHAIIQVDENGQNCIILYGGTNRQITEAYVDEVLAHFEAGDVLVLQNEINCMPYICLLYTSITTASSGARRTLRSTSAPPPNPRPRNKERN